MTASSLISLETFYEESYCMNLQNLIVRAGAFAAAVAVIFPVAADARPVRDRFARQQQRIDQGVASGQLTSAEYNRDQVRLNRDEALYRRDLRSNHGHLTRVERVNLNARLNRNSRDIYFTKHNRVDQPGV